MGGQLAMYVLRTACAIFPCSLSLFPGVACSATARGILLFTRCCWPSPRSSFPVCLPRTGPPGLMRSRKAGYLLNEVDYEVKGDANALHAPAKSRMQQEQSVCAARVIVLTVTTVDPCGSVPDPATRQRRSCPGCLQGARSTFRRPSPPALPRSKWRRLSLPPGAR